MDILVALKQEESKLEKQLKGIHKAILAFDDSISSRHGANTDKSVRPRRTISPAARAAIGPSPVKVMC
jgi:hypothetical protein